MIRSARPLAATRRTLASAATAAVAVSSARAAAGLASARRTHATAVPLTSVCAIAACSQPTTARSAPSSSGSLRPSRSAHRKFVPAAAATALVPIPSPCARCTHARPARRHASYSTASLVPTAPTSLVFNHFGTGFAKHAQALVVPDRRSPLKSIQCGEDAFFSRYNCVGVGDGVGGWQGQANANAGLFARKLMHYCSAELERAHEVPPNVAARDEIDPVGVLQHAYHRTVQDAQSEGFVGSTTACVVLLVHDELRIANLGDGAVLVIRQGEFVFRTEEQVHSFNYPYQLGTAASDLPTHAQQFRVKAHHGDIVLVVSDGILDNLFEEDILAAVREHVPKPTVDPPIVPLARDPGLPAGAAGTAETASSHPRGFASWLTSPASSLAKSVRAAVAGPPPPPPPPAAEPVAPIPDPSAHPLGHDVPMLPPVSSASAADPAAAVPDFGPPHVIPAAYTGLLALADQCRAASVADQVALARAAAVAAAAAADPRRIAEALARRAKDVAEDVRCASPFQTRALHEGLYFQGGKTDDISVVVAVVRDPAQARAEGLAAAAAAAAAAGTEVGVGRGADVVASMGGA
ncbi:hypothetical protein GGF31_005113 [Allomyces arbusculus]|nr:hypothetical protein GGF31_005113 [Allomyces arbusculus]